ncbi:ABC transporter ATP-binding protein [Synergistales bacterium]|nr:ABC transporter ATP-binding protein [Synergistales bacterium]
MDDRLLIAFVCGLVVVFIIIKNLITALAMLRTTYLAENISAYIGEETLTRYFHRDYLWHISPESADVINRLGFRTVLSGHCVTLLQMYGNIICSVTLFAVMFSLQPLMTLFVMGAFAIVGGTTYLKVRRRVDEAGKEVSGASMKENASLSAARRGIREVLIYRQQKAFLSRIFSGIREGIAPRAFLGIVGILPSWLLEVTGFATILCVIYLLIRRGAGIPEIISASSLLLLTAWRVLPSVSRVTNFAVSIRGSRPMALTCLELLEKFITQQPQPQPEPDPNFRFEKNIVLNSVCFRYPTSPTDSLRNISMTINKGTSVGLIGASGAGKTTLALILSGLLPLREGEFLVDGQTLSPAGWAAYRRKVGFVPQNPFLMGGTLADNVAFSRWGQEYDKAKVERACRQAAADFAFSRPEGVDMHIGEDGAGLSGGETQRISIARALFAEPEILIFDEATSSLDQTNENIIRSTIDALHGQITAIIIAHRLTTVENCDIIFWVDNGQILSMGAPADVLPLYNSTMLVTEENFNAKAYLGCNPDVATVCAGDEQAAWEHFRVYGKNERRRQFNSVIH